MRRIVAAAVVGPLGTLRPVATIGTRFAVRPRITLRAITSGISRLVVARLLIPLRPVVALRARLVTDIVAVIPAIGLTAVGIATSAAARIHVAVITGLLLFAVLIVILVGGVAVMPPPIVIGVVTIGIVARAVVAVALRPILEARAILIEDAVIMIRELQIIFGLHPIPGELRVTRHRLVLFVQLGRVATGPGFGAIATPVRPAFHPLGTGAATPATAAGLSIVDQWVSF